MPTIQLNEVHRRTVKAWNAFLAAPQLHQFMKLSLRHRLQTLAEKVRPALVELAHRDDREDDEISAAEVTLANTRQLLVRIYRGIRYRYANRPEVLAALAPVRTGANAAEDEVRLATLARVLPGCEPVFLWLPEEGITPDFLHQQLNAHREAMKRVAAISARDVDAAALLRELRPAAQALWDEELDAWIGLNVPREQHLAWGRERRRQPRGASAAEQQPPADPLPLPMPPPGPMPESNPESPLEAPAESAAG